MYRINSALSNIIRGACQQLLGPLTSTGRAAGGRVEVARALCLGAPRLQEVGTQSHHDGASASPARDSKDFSYYPPFPGQESALKWDGKTFEELPIAHIKATYNNTHIQVTDSMGQHMARTSCGTEGFRNARKSTPIAAQTAGISAAALLIEQVPHFVLVPLEQKAQTKGATFVRVVLKGLGPGR
ncbi:hypothetical protein P4O66_006822, partial [Electrophorus voltai]